MFSPKVNTQYLETYTEVRRSKSEVCLRGRSPCRHEKSAFLTNRLLMTYLQEKGLGVQEVKGNCTHGLQQTAI